MTLFEQTGEPIAPPSPSMNEGQQKAYTDILDFITGKLPQNLIWVLKGYAGTGKTFTLTQVVKELRRRHEAGMADFRIAMSAPTHKAVRVMKKFSTLPFNSVHFSTIHSLLGLKAEIDERTGREKFVESKDPNELRIEQFNVLFLDEVSMLADEIFIALLKYVRQGLKVVFIGDPVQIPPVNHLDTIPFKPGSEEKYQLGISELTLVMRQAGENPILGLATTIRMGYKTVPHFMIQTALRSDVGSSGVQGVQKIEPSPEGDPAIDKIIMEFFCSSEFKSDPDYMKVIAYTNKTVDNFNRAIRKRIYAGEQDSAGNLPAILPGEKLIMDKPLVLETGRVLLTTNEEVEVVSYDIRDAKVEYQAPVFNGSWQMQTRDALLKHYNAVVNYYDATGKKVQANIRILHESEANRMKEITDSLSKGAQSIPTGNPLRSKTWRSFYGVQRVFAQVKYNYAITGHKSQGSTYSNVLFLDWDLHINRKLEERNRIRYVAITRARHLVMIQQ